jgi:hypothetical protein
MPRRSLTIQILLAVGVTVAVVIAIYSYFVIRIQTTWWHERTEAQNVFTAGMIHEHLDRVMIGGRGAEVQAFLQELKTSQEIFRARVIRPDGKIIFSSETQEIAGTYFNAPPELFENKRILQGTRTENGQLLAVAMTPLMNHESCFQCHESKQPILGAVVIEKSMEQARASIAANRNLLLAYGVVIFVLVGCVLWLLIMRFVTQPVRALLQQMQRVQEGDLAARAPMDSRDEIGQLARGFNEMVESLETTRRELHESHEKQIQQAGKLASIGELASGIAHEIRNPLAGIGAAIEVLAEKHNGNGNGNGNGQYQEVAVEIHQQINRLNHTLRDLLDFARPREPEVEPCDAHEVIKPMLALVRPDAQKHHIQIVEEFDPGLPAISADAQQLQQAILNVLLNAVQAMPNGGTLTVKTERKTGRIPVRSGNGDGQDAGPASVRITIRDTGVGIPAESREKIFSPFYTTKHRGTGLGLSITRNIIEKHHGTIAVESEPGRGTVFTLEFAACAETRC